MQPLSHYLALALIYAPISAAIALLLCACMRRLNRFLDRLFTVRPGGRYRDESWHTKQPGERLQQRTRR